MKKQIAFLLSMIILLASCSSGEVSNPSVAFEYSNIMNAEIQEFTSNLLSRNGVAQDSIDTVLSFIRDFYNGYENIVENGWVSIDLEDFYYDFDDALNHWESKERDRIDMNCRNIAYILTKDIIAFDTNALINEAKDEYTLPILQSAIYLSDAETRKYSAVFGDIESTALDKDSWIDNILSYRKEFEIEFDDNATIKLLCLYIQPPSSSSAQVAHAAVVVEENDYCYLIEKYDPMYPYQISKFASISDLVSYIYADRCSRERIGETTNYIVMINNEHFSIW